MCLGLGAVEGIEDATGVQRGAQVAERLGVRRAQAGRDAGGGGTDGERIAYAVLGLGLNVNLDFNAPASGMPPDLAAAATSLSAALGRKVDRGGLLAAILTRFEDRYGRLLAGESPHGAWPRG